MQHHPAVMVQLSRIIGVVLVPVVVECHKERGTLHRVQRRLVKSLREELLPRFRPLCAISSGQTGHQFLAWQRCSFVVQDMFDLHLNLTCSQQSVAVVNQHLVEAALVIHYDMIRILEATQIYHYLSSTCINY